MAGDIIPPDWKIGYYCKLKNSNITIYVIRSGPNGIIKTAVSADQNGNILKRFDPYTMSIDNLWTDQKVAYEAAKFYKNIPDIKLDKGTLTLNSNNPYNAPLIIAYGGIHNGNILADEYMQKYLINEEKVKNNFSIWIAKSSKVVNGKVKTTRDGRQKQAYPGPESYDELNQALQNYNITPSKKILYLFSGGGCYEGVELANAGYFNKFDEFYLIDIWLGPGTGISSKYVNLAKTNSNEVFYFYTPSGPAGDNSLLIKTINPGNSKNCGRDHYACNTIALNFMVEKLLTSSIPSSSSSTPPNQSSTTNTTVITPPQASPGTISTGEGTSPDISFAKKIAIQNASKNYSGDYDIVDEQLFQLSDGTYKWTIKIQYN